MTRLPGPRNPGECHLYVAEGCHLYIALTTFCRITSVYGKSRRRRRSSVRTVDQPPNRPPRGATGMQHCKPVGWPAPDRATRPPSIPWPGETRSSCSPRPRRIRRSLGRDLLGNAFGAANCSRWLASDNNGQRLACTSQQRPDGRPFLAVSSNRRQHIVVDAWRIPADSAIPLRTVPLLNHPPSPFPRRLPSARLAGTQSGNFGNSICREYDHPLTKAKTVASGRPSGPTTPESNDAGTGMGRSLGLGTDFDPAAPSLSDPMNVARQVVRSQAARDGAERELVHAEATIQELRTRLHHAHREKDAALEAARLATAAKLAAQRSILEAEASRDRSDRMLREALATNRDLQAKLDAFGRDFETARAEPAAERQARLKADDSRREGPLATEPEAALPASHDDAVIHMIRRPVGRPRKTAAPAPAPNKTGGKVMDSDEIVAETAGSLQKKARNRQATGQEPVQWWVEGWSGRRS
jgi:hypothetical protein